jgi:hypothetical protein
MDRQRHYLENREWCLQQACITAVEEQRVMLLHIADTWKRLADSVGATQQQVAVTLAPASKLSRLH